MTKLVLLQMKKSMLWGILLPFSVFFDTLGRIMKTVNK